jgi:hypothetical protein
VFEDAINECQDTRPEPESTDDVAAACRRKIMSPKE